MKKHSAVYDEGTRNALKAIGITPMREKLSPWPGYIFIRNEDVFKYFEDSKLKTEIDACWEDDVQSMVGDLEEAKAFIAAGCLGFAVVKNNEAIKSIRFRDSGARELRTAMEKTMDGQTKRERILGKR